MVKEKKNKAMLLKLDFQKAYDAIRWSFLESMLENMGFGTKWRKWINMCVFFVSLSILINISSISPSC